MLKTEIKTYFDDFDTILEDREKYNIEWAFKDAQEKLNQFDDNLINTKLKDRCTLCKHKSKMNNEFLSFKKQSMKLLKKQKRQTSIFSNVYSLLTMVEFIVSILLVLVISEISHSGEGMIESEIFSLWVVFTFAFLKVFIERYYIKPRMEAFGWSLYEHSIKRLKEMTLIFNEQVDNDIVEIIPEQGLELA